MVAFEGAAALLRDALVAIRVEVSFRRQPLFGDIDAHLQGQDFIPAGFPEVHACWSALKRGLRGRGPSA